MQKRFLAVVLMFVAMSSSVWAECGNLCDYNWWETATTSDVQAELDAGADVNAHTKGGYTPLHWAAGWGNTEGVKLLITAGADITARDETGYTPLHWVASRGTAEGVLLVIDAGADITAKTEDGKTVWDLAQKNDKLAGTEIRWSLAEALGKCARLCDDKWWETATASDVQALLDAGADITARTEGGATPLHWVASRGTAEGVLLVIDAGADVMARNEWGFTPLHSAAAYGTAEMVQLLITAGADVNARSEWGRTPLHWAAASGTAEMVQLLITAGVDVMARTEDGRTPLHWAAEGGTAETTVALITAGADITAKDEDGRSVWDLARLNYKLAGTEALWSLAEALGKCSRWCDADWWKQTTAADLQALLDAGVYNNLSDEDRETAWNLAKSSPLKGSAAYWALNDARFK